MPASSTNKREELENGLVGFRLKYLYDYYKVQLALVTGTLVILLGFYANVDDPTATGTLKISVSLLGIATVTQMVIYLNIFMRMRKLWNSDGSIGAGKVYLTLFIINFTSAIAGLLTGYLFLIANF